MKTVKIIIPDEKPLSWNMVYAGSHWSVRQLEKDRVKYRIIENATHPEIFVTRVDIFIVAYFSGRPYDSDNIFDKIYVDGLKGLYLKDDSPQYVRYVATRSEKDANNPRLEIEIIEVD